MIPLLKWLIRVPVLIVLTPFMLIRFAFGDSWTHDFRNLENYLDAWRIK